MSERTIKFIFKGEERKVRVFANYEECKKAFQNEFSLTDEEMDKIHKLNKEKRYFNMPYEQQVKWFSQYNPID